MWTDWDVPFQKHLTGLFLCEGDIILDIPTQWCGNINEFGAGFMFAQECAGIQFAFWLVDGIEGIFTEGKGCDRVPVTVISRVIEMVRICFSHFTNRLVCLGMRSICVRIPFQQGQRLYGLDVRFIWLYMTGFQLVEKYLRLYGLQIHAAFVAGTDVG